MADLPTILLTGFEPFDCDPANSSWGVARMLDGVICEGAVVRAVQLPCEYGLSIQRLDEAMAKWRPQLIVAMGQASGRAELTPERVAINMDDARIADNGGARPIDVPVIPGGPVAYFSTLPIKAIVRELRNADLPAAVSNTAGTFVCNHVFYALMHRLATRPELVAARGGFIHLPCLPEQAARVAGMPSMALQVQVESVRRALCTAWRVRQDVCETGGQIS